MGRTTNIDGQLQVFTDKLTVKLFTSTVQTIISKNQKEKFLFELCIKGKIN